AVYLFPELDVLPYERLPLGGEILHQRLRAMLALAGEARGQGPGVREEPTPDPRPPTPDPPPAPFVVVTARGAMDRVMAPADARERTRRINVGDRIRPDELVSEWVRTGYEPVPVVQGPGEFARCAKGSRSRCWRPTVAFWDLLASSITWRPRDC